MPVTFGVGCAAYRNGLLGHNGSARGQTCGLRFDPYSNIAMVIGTNVWKPFFRDSIIDHVLSTIRGESIKQFSAEPFKSSLNDLAGTYLGPQGVEVKVICEGDQIICTLNNQYAPSMNFLIQKSEKGILRACSNTQHYSLGFFREAVSCVDGLMLGMTAFRRQYHNSQDR